MRQEQDADTHDARGNRLLDLLPDDERDDLLARLEPIRLDIKHPVFEPDKPIEHVYFPTSMVVSMLTVMEDGQAVEVATIGNEGLAGLPVFLGAATSPGLSFCQVPGWAMRMPAGAFRDRANAGGALHELLQRYTSAFFVDLAQGSACNRLHGLDQRLARWLLTTQDRAGMARFPLTQEFMAQMLAVRRATVSEAAGRLQQAGLITYSRGLLTVTDRQGLEDAACECYRVVTEAYARLAG